MSKPLANPPRLSRLHDAEDALGVGRMFRDARDLPEEELPTLHWRLRTSQRLRALRPRLVLRVALVVGIVFCLGGVVGAFVSPFRARKEAAGQSARPDPALARHRKPHVTGAAMPAPESQAPPAVAATPAVTSPVANEPASAPADEATVADRQSSSRTLKRTASHRLAAVARPVPPPAPAPIPAVAPAPSPSSSIAIEQALLGQAVKLLRHDRDARGALVVLAEHAQRFPTGALAAEGAMLRIEALLDLGRRDEALAILDGADLASLPNRDAQRVVRGELRAANGRWPEAKHDFDEVLGQGTVPAANPRLRKTQERALWGRASARSRLGDQAGARADLELYLRDFPDGRFASEAAALVKGSR